MDSEQLKAQIREMQEKLDALKHDDPAAYERMLAEIGDALAEFNRMLSTI